jgi:hypothetical protein
MSTGSIASQQIQKHILQATVPKKPRPTPIPQLLNRRHDISLLASSTPSLKSGRAHTSTARTWPRHSSTSPCSTPHLPSHIALHEVLQPPRPLRTPANSLCLLLRPPQPDASPQRRHHPRHPLYMLISTSQTSLLHYTSTDYHLNHNTPKSSLF